MIKMTMLTGPHAGKTKIVPPEIDAKKILSECLNNGWAWEIDYFQATQTETVQWFKHDFSCRIIRALTKDLPITFLGKTYSIKNPNDRQEFESLAGEIEDTIANSGYLVSIEHDNETGVAVSTQGFVH